METLLTISTYVTGLNIILIFSLMYVYLRNFRKIRSLFTLGLLLFSLLFIIQNIFSFYFYITMMPIYEKGLELYALIFTVLQTFAFAIMNWITWK